MQQVKAGHIVKENIYYLSWYAELLKNTQVSQFLERCRGDFLEN